MLQAVIVAHPNPDSFTLSVAHAYAQAAEAAGGQVVVRDLYAMNFDPCLKRDEIPSEPDYRLHPDVAAERAALEGVGLYVLVYPFWVNAPPGSWASASALPRMERVPIPRPAARDCSASPLRARRGTGLLTPAP